MTKEQVIKHKGIITWFLDNPDKGVWYYGSDGDDNWHLRYAPQFLEEHTYVQNDEYAEYRKALADGETVERFRYHTTTDDIWDCVSEIDTNYSTSRYRIKPPEPTFKVGDWVYYSSENRIVQIAQFEDAMENTVNINLYMAKHNKNIKLWEPVEGEFCVFWYEVDSYYIGKYRETVESDTHPYKDDIDFLQSGWDNIAPLEFIEILKGK